MIHKLKVYEKNRIIILMNYVRQTKYLSNNKTVLFCILKIASDKERVRERERARKRNKFIHPISNEGYLKCTASYCNKQTKYPKE